MRPERYECWTGSRVSYGDVRFHHTTKDADTLQKTRVNA